MAQPLIPIAQPIAQPKDDRALAPWPAIDKYPVVIGPGLSLQYISSIFRLSLVGYRHQYVDLLDELLEKDPHSFSVLSKRILGVAGGKLELLPAEIVGNKKAQKQAERICAVCCEMLAALPCVEQMLAEISWAVFFGVVGQEIHWQRDGAGWYPERTSLVHSRRLSYPVSGSWDLYVWDQGQVLSENAFGSSPTNARTFGARVADYPGKFIIHAPQLRGGYPTRNGLGRQIAYWMALKLIATRGAPRYLERFASPWPEGTYWTGHDGDGPNARRPASNDDIASATTALAAMGAGTLSSWLHADTVKLDLRTPDSGSSSSKLTFSEWIAVCNSEISKAVIGGTLTTEVGSTGGNRSLGETQKKSETQLLKYDAKLVAATLKRDFIAWIVRLNFPSCPMSMVPRVLLHVEDPPDPMAIIEKGAKAAGAGIPVDADALAAQANVPVVRPGDMKARRMFPILGTKTPELFDADLAERAEALRPEQTEETEEPEPGAKPDDEDDDAEHDPDPDA